MVIEFTLQDGRKLSLVYNIKIRSVLSTVKIMNNKD